MEIITQRIVDSDSLVELIDRIEENHWPAMPDRIIYQVAGAGSKEAAQAIVNQYIAQRVESTKTIYLLLASCTAVLGGIAGNMLGTWTDTNWNTNHADIALTLFGGIGSFFGTLLHPPRRIDIMLGISQAFQEGRSYAVPNRPAEEEEIPFNMVPTGNKI